MSAKKKKKALFFIYSNSIWAYFHWAENRTIKGQTEHVNNVTYVPLRQRCYRCVTKTLYWKKLTTTLIPICAFIKNSHTIFTTVFVYKICLQKLSIKTYPTVQKRKNFNFCFQLLRVSEKDYEFEFMKFEFELISYIFPHIIF